MSRRHSAQKREVLPDAKFGDTLISKIINCMMYDGKKSVAEKIMYEALDLIQSKSNTKSSVEILHEAIENVKPSVEVRARRVGGSTYQIPVEVRAKRRNALAIGYIIDFSRKRSEKTMVKRFCAEILDAAANKGSAVRKKEEIHKMAEANRAFAHYRW